MSRSRLIIVVLLIGAGLYTSCHCSGPTSISGGPSIRPRQSPRTIASLSSDSPRTVFPPPTTGLTRGKRPSLARLTGEDSPLAVTGSTRIKGRKIRIRFSEDMVEDSKVNKPAPPALITIEPGLPGRLAWRGASELELTPKKIMPVNRRYRITVKAGVASTGGKKLGQSVSFDVKRVRNPVAVEVNTVGREVKVVFNQRMCPARGQGLKITPPLNGRGKRARGRWTHETLDGEDYEDYEEQSVLRIKEEATRSTYTVEASRPPDPEITYKVKLPAGLMSCSGNEYDAKEPLSFTGDKWELDVRVGEKMIRWYPRKGRPRIVVVDPACCVRTRKLDLTLIFDQAVTPRQIAALVTLKTEAGKKIPFVLTHPAKDMAAGEASISRKQLLGLRFARPVTGEHRITLSLDSALDTGTGREGTYTYSTPGKLQVTGVSGGDKTYGKPGDATIIATALDGDAKIMLNNNLPSGGEKNAVVAPAGVEVAVEEYDDGSSAIGLSFEKRTPATVVIKPDLTDVFGQRLGRTVTIKFSHIESDQPFKIKMRTGVVSLDRKAYRGRFPVSMNQPGDLLFDTCPVVPKDLTSARHQLSDDSKLPPGCKTQKVRFGPRLNKGWAGGTIPVPRGAFLMIRPRLPSTHRWDPYEGDAPGSALVQATDLGLSIRALSDGYAVWTTELSTGRPRGAARVSMYVNKEGRVARVETDAEGYAAVPAPGGLKPLKHAVVFVAESKGDAAFVAMEPGDAATAENFDKIGEDRYKNPVTSAGRVGLVFAERGIFRPGETAHIKAIVRSISERNQKLPASVDLSVVGPGDQKLAAIKLTLGSFGTASHTLKIPRSVKLGLYHLRLLDGGEVLARGQLRVAEFRVPQFEVQAGVEGKVMEGRARIRARVRSRYFFGAPVAGGELELSVRRRGVPFRPIRYAAYRFPRPAAEKGTQIHTAEVIVDAAGKHEASVVTDLSSLRSPQRVTVQATVKDQTGQAITGRAHTVLHPVSSYLGLRPFDRYLKPGSRLPVEAALVTPRGNPVKGRAVRVELLRHKEHVYHYFGSGNALAAKVEKDLVPVTSCVGRTDAAGKSRCVVRLKTAGSYMIRASAGPGASVLRPVSAYGWSRAPGAATKLVIDLDTTRKRFRPGETATFMVRSPYARARGLLTVERQEVLFHRVVSIGRGLTRISVPIKEEYGPNAFVALHMVAPRRGRVADPVGVDITRPVYHLGVTEIQVSSARDTLDVKLTTDKKVYRPGQQVTVDLQVARGGKPARAEVTLMAVDEAVLSLTRYATPRPRRSLVPLVNLRMAATDLRAKLPSSAADVYVAKLPEGGGGDMDMEQRAGAPSPLSVRHRFDWTAHFDPAVLTDDRGRARVQFTLPDSLTTYRIMAVAVNRKNASGSMATKVRTEKPLQALPALPRFLRAGDRVTLGATIHNNTDRALRAEARLDCASLAFDGKPVKKLRVPARASALVQFTGEVKQPRDEHTVSVGVSARKKLPGGRWEHVSDAMKIKVPGKSAGLPVHAAISGSARGEAVIDLNLPAKIEPGGSLELTLSNNPMASLLPAMESLVRYPYGCVEQTTSSTVPLLALRELLPALGSARFTDEIMRKYIDRGLRRLVSMRTGSGGLAFWPGGSQPHLFGTAYAMLALSEAHRQKLYLPPGFLDGVRKYLTGAIKEKSGKRLPLDLRAYLAFVLAVTGAPQPAVINSVYAFRGDLSMFGKMFLARAIAATRRSDKRAAALLREVDAAFDSDGRLKDAHREGDEDYALYPFHTGSVIGALALLTHDQVTPSSGWNDVLAKRLMVESSWETTQDTAITLVALSAYMRSIKKAAWGQVEVELDGAPLPASSKTTAGAGTHRWSLPIETLAGKKDVPLRIEIGEGRAIFFSLQGRYTVPLDPKKHAGRSSGSLSLYREVADMSGKPLKGKVIKRGQLVRVTLTLHAGRAAEYVFVDDPLPGGLEAVDPALATTASEPADPDPEEYTGEEEEDGQEKADYLEMTARERADKLVSHQEYRDDRVVFFFDKLFAGLYTFSYLARATTPGTFRMIPPTAGEMYDPSTAASGEAGVCKVR